MHCLNTTATDTNPILWVGVRQEVRPLGSCVASCIEAAHAFGNVDNQANLRKQEERVEMKKRSLLKSIELGTSIDPSGDPTVETHADGGMSWRALLRESYREILLEEKDIMERGKAIEKRYAEVGRGLLARLLR